MTCKRVTIKSINMALADAGIDCEIVKGRGYFYFTGNAVDLAREQGVYGITRLNGYSIEQWVAVARERCSK